MILKINGQELDGMTNDPIVGNFRVADYGQFAKSQGGYTNRFSVLATVNNRAILDNCQIHYSASQMPYNLESIEVWTGGIPLYQGQAIIERTSSEKVDITVLQGNSEWFSLIKALNFEDMDLSGIWAGAPTQLEIAQRRLQTTGMFYPAIEYGLSLGNRSRRSGIVE